MIRDYCQTRLEVRGEVVLPHSIFQQLQQQQQNDNKEIK